MSDRTSDRSRRRAFAGGLGVLFRQLLMPAAVGAVTGACVAAASGFLEDWWLGRLASLPGALPAVFPPLAMLLTLLVTRRLIRRGSPSTSELYILTYHQPGASVSFRQLPGRLLAAATTVGFGGSQGFESASVLIGASWSGLLARWLRVPASDEDRRSCLAAGASAGIAAVFSSPAMGMLYGMEVPYKRDVDAPRLAPCAVAAVCSYFTRDALIGAKHLVDAPGAVSVDAAFLGGCLAVAVACGLGARLFALAEDGLRRLARRSPPWQRALLAGAALAGLAWAGYALCGTWITFGPGYFAADWALAGPHPLGLLAVALLVRAGGNLLSVYGGGGGGVFTSLACNGVFVGQIVASAVGCTQTRVLALLGAACFLGSGYRLPLACMLFAAEASGSLVVTAAGLVVMAVGQVLMGEASVSDAQVEERGEPPA
jgi:CIC family chloride channel protein